MKIDLFLIRTNEFTALRYSTVLVVHSSPEYVVVMKVSSTHIAISTSQKFYSPLKLTYALFIDKNIHAIKTIILYAIICNNKCTCVRYTMYIVLGK